MEPREQLEDQSCRQMKIESFRQTWTGQTQLLELLLSEPKALLLDEPFSSLDPEHRNAFRKFVIDKVKESKIPCLLVTHDETDKKISHEKPINLNMFIT